MILIKIKNTANKKCLQYFLYNVLNLLYKIFSKCQNGCNNMIRI